MIQPTAPTLAAGLAQTAGMASNAGAGASAGASPGAENPSFAALLEGGTTAIAPLAASLDPAPAASLPSAAFATGKPLDPLIAALRAGNAEGQGGNGGKDGKAIGKNLPSMPDDAGSITDLAQAPGEAITDALGVPIGLAGILALPGALPSGQTPPATSAAATATPAAASTSQGRPAAAAPIEALLARRTALSNRTPALDAAQLPVASPPESTRGMAAIAPASPALPANAPIELPRVTFTAIEIVPAGDPRTAPPATTPASGAVAGEAIAEAALPEVATAAGAKTEATSDVPAAKAKKADKLSTALLGEARPSPPEASLPAIGTDTAAARPAAASVVTTTGATPPAADGPQDFATLVSRLAEAREAADPQLVRTSLAHGEFGRVSLQFRHEDAGMAVTMASADPDFTRSVQAAAAASLAGGNAGPGDQPRGDTPQSHTSAQQQGQATAQAGAGTGNGAGGQSQQGRTEQADRIFQRETGTASRAQDPEASSPRQSRDGTRPGGGVYA